MIPTITAALRAVSTPRFFDTERGYQGELLAELRKELPALGLPGGVIVEQEYQKTLPAHKVKVRPDIIVHVPTAAGGDRAAGNFAVFELKRRASTAEAREDFDSLDAVIAALNYPLGVFVNVDSEQTRAADYVGPYRDRIHFFAVRLVDGVAAIRHAHYTANGLVER